MHALLMASISDKLAKGANWIWGTFTGSDTLRHRRDIPGLLARWLFRIGTIWAVVLLPVTVMVCFVFTVFVLAGLGTGKSMGGGAMLCPYLLTGYALWVGWGWRSRKPRNVVMCVLFWLASAGFNVMQPVHIWMETHSVLALLFPPPLWGIVATGASLTALVFEFSPPGYARSR